MKGYTFTVYTDNNKIYGYLFNITRAEAQEQIEKINQETGCYHYYEEGYYEV